MTDRRFGLQLRAGAHAELARLAADLQCEARKHLPSAARWDPVEPEQLPPGWLASMENAETMRRRYKAGGPVTPSFFPVMPLRLEPAKPPEPSKREVLTVEAGLFTVAGWCLATIDRVLAECVAREFDRIDPLPPVEGP